MLQILDYSSCPLLDVCVQVCLQWGTQHWAQNPRCVSPDLSRGQGLPPSSIWHWFSFFAGDHSCNHSFTHSLYAKDEQVSSILLIPFILSAFHIFLLCISGSMYAKRAKAKISFLTPDLPEQLSQSDVPSFPLQVSILPSFHTLSLTFES